MTVLVCQVPDYLERFTLLPLDRENLSLSTYLYLTQGAPAEIIMGYGSDLQEKHAGFLVHCLSRCESLGQKCLLEKSSFAVPFTTSLFLNTVKEAILED